MRKRWKIFADAYIQTWNATASAKAAGYSERTAYSIGSRLLKNVEIWNYIDANVMSAHEILGRLSEQARGSYAEFLQADGSVDFEGMKEAGKLHLIKRVKKYSSQSEKGGYTESSEVEFVDGQTALIHLGKHRKLFTDKTDVDIGDRLAAKLDKYNNLAEKIYAERSDTDEDHPNSA